MHEALALARDSVDSVVTKLFAKGGCRLTRVEWILRRVRQDGLTVGAIINARGVNSEF